MTVIVQDILLNEDFDLEFKNGDFVVGDSDEQHIQLIALIEPGQIRHSPLTGLGIAKRLQSPMSLRQQDALRRAAYLQLEIDGYQSGAASVEITDTITIKADR